MFLNSLWKPLLVLLAGAADGAPAAEDESPLAAYYGFLPVEVYKVSDRSSALMAGDFNHDGLTDLVVIDNGNNRLDLFLQRTKPAEQPKTSGAKNVNKVENSWRLEHVKVPVDIDITSLTVGDFNGDGRHDLAYLGSPDQLVIRFQPEHGEWTKKKQIRVPELSGQQWQLAAGDVNHDGTDDLVVLTKSELLLFEQRKGEIGTPRRLLNTTDKMGLVMLSDLDGDARNDVCYVAGEGNDRAFCGRLQNTVGELGPEYVFGLDRPRAVTVKDLDGKPGSEIMSIDSRTGRLKLSRIERKRAASDDVSERIVQYGFGKPGGNRDRDFAVGDLDGDGRLDVIVTDPQASQVIVFRQHAETGLDLGTPYASLAGADQIRLGDLNGNGRLEIVIQSSAEKTIGVCEFRDGRVTFPSVVSNLTGEPSGIDLFDVNGDGKANLVALLKTKMARNTTYELAFPQQGPDGAWLPLAQGQTHTLNLPTSPERLANFRLTRAGQNALFVFFGSGKPPQVQLVAPDGGLTEIVTAGSLGLGNVGAAATTFCELDGVPGVLVSQDNIARLMQLDDANRWQVKDQFNIPESEAKIVATAVCDLDGIPGPELVFVDLGIKKLRIWRKAGGSFSPWKEVDMGSFPFKSIEAADLNGDGRSDLLLTGNDRLGVLYSQGDAPILKEFATYESKLERIFPTDVVAGDFNDDGFVDLAMTDVRNQYLELIQWRPETGPVHALYFKVFEQKTFQNDEKVGADPREAIAADVTGDGKTDLVLLAHDRLIVYPQDPGPDTKAASNQK